jgi:hypothetical protein
VNYAIDQKLAEVQVKQHYGTANYQDWRELADLIIAYIDIEEGRYGRRSEDVGAGWGS